MRPEELRSQKELKVGFIALAVLVAIGVFSVLFNTKRSWFEKCQAAMVELKDASGIRTRSAVRSRGIGIGYVASVVWNVDHPRAYICITAPVTVLPNTRARLENEVFFGDPFIDLRPIHYLGGPKPAA